MTGAEDMEGNSSEVSSPAEMHSNQQLDALKHSRGLLSYRSRKMLGLLAKSGVAGQAEKKVSAPTSARDVKLEVIANPPEQLSMEHTKEQPKKSILEVKKTVRTVVARNGGSILSGRVTDRQSRKPPNVDSGSFDEPVQTPPPKKKPLLPAKLKLLETFYEGLEAAISLLAIRRQMCTFKSICKTVEQMSKRRFLRSHLAQLKFLFPEVIEIDYVRVPDLDSRRDVWDLRICLKSFVGLPGGSPLKGAASPSRDKNSQTIRRKREFHSRLLKFSRSTNENVDVPQEPLPQRPLGGLSMSSPNVSSGLPAVLFPTSVDVAFDTNFEMKQRVEKNSEAPSTVNEVAHHQVSKVPDGPEAEPAPASIAEEVYEFSIVQPDSGSFLDIDVSSHFPPSFKPHFQERNKELSSIERPDPVDFLDIGLTSHFAPSFKPQFQERQRELSTESSCHSGSVPSEVHLQTSAISSRTTARFSTSFEHHSSQPWKEGIPEDDISESLQSSDVGEESCKPSPLDTEEASSSLLPAELNSESCPHRDSSVLEAEESAASGEQEGGESQEVSTIYSAEQSPLRDSSVYKALEATPAEHRSSMSPAIMSPLSIPQNHSHTPQSVCTSLSTPCTSVPSTPHTSGASVQSSPATEHTPASFSPSRFSYYVQESPVPVYVKNAELLSTDAVPVRSQGIMRSLKFGSPTRSARTQIVAEELAPNTPQVGTAPESTPKDESKYAPFQSSSHTPQTTTPETSLGKSSYFSPVRPQRSRALLFSTPEKVRDTEVSVTKSGTPSSSQHFKSLQTGGSMKPPRFMSPPKSQTLSAPATPVPQTPMRSILYSPPKRTKFNRGSLFSTDTDEEDVGQTPGPNGDEAKASMDAACTATPDLELSTDPCPREESFNPLKDSPTVTAKELSYVSAADLAIIDSLPAELVLSVREKERKINDENTKELMVRKRRQQMMAGLPKMFNQLRLIFQSLKRSVLPRNELIRNVLSTNADITDRGEVEERLKLLVELAPDWISKHPSANGDYIYRINKTANVTRIQKKILEDS
ncbi:hypothetical protein Mapa_010686 [Marchantia paleacea]|nr:hypothetical protein Mapa_010686 [Marchantia paleacea]